MIRQPQFLAPKALMKFLPLQSTGSLKRKHNLLGLGEQAKSSQGGGRTVTAPGTRRGTCTSRPQAGRKAEPASRAVCRHTETKGSIQTSDNPESEAGLAERARMGCSGLDPVLGKVMEGQQDSFSPGAQVVPKAKVTPVDGPNARSSPALLHFTWSLARAT